MSLALTTELEAINVMLQAADEAPVASLSTEGLYPLEQAKAILLETSRTVQSIGWAFNTETDFPLARNVDNEIPLPGNLASLDVNDEYTDVDPIQRGLKLYDKKSHSYTFARDIKGTAVFLLEWTELPQPARQFITIKAARTMQSRIGTELSFRLTEEDEQQAWLALSALEADTGDHNMLRDSWSVASVLFNREMQ